MLDLAPVLCSSLDFQNSPSSDLIWRGTKTSRDFVAGLGASRPKLVDITKFIGSVSYWSEIGYVFQGNHDSV